MFSNTTNKIVLLKNGVNFNLRLPPHMCFFKCEFSNIFFFNSINCTLKKLVISNCEMIILTHKKNLIFISSIGEDIQSWRSHILGAWIIPLVPNCALCWKAFEIWILLQTGPWCFHQKLLAQLYISVFSVFVFLCFLHKLCVIYS